MLQLCESRSKDDCSIVRRNTSDSYSKNSQSVGPVFSVKLELATEPRIPASTADLGTWEDQNQIWIHLHSSDLSTSTPPVVWEQIAIHNQSQATRGCYLRSFTPVEKQGACPGNLQNPTLWF